MDNNHIYTFEKLIFNFLMGSIEKGWFSIEFNSPDILDLYCKRLVDEYNFASYPYNLSLVELPATKMLVMKNKNNRPTFVIPIQQREIGSEYIQIGGDDSDLFILD